MDLNNKLKLSFEIEDMAKNINDIVYDLYIDEFKKDKIINTTINKEIIKEDNLEDREI